MYNVLNNCSRVRKITLLKKGRRIEIAKLLQACSNNLPKSLHFWNCFWAPAADSTRFGQVWPHAGKMLTKCCRHLAQCAACAANRWPNLAKLGDPECQEMIQNILPGNMFEHLTNDYPILCGGPSGGE